VVPLEAEGKNRLARAGPLPLESMCRDTPVRLSTFHVTPPRTILARARLSGVMWAAESKIRKNRKTESADSPLSLIMLEEDLIQMCRVIDAAEAQMLQQCGVRYLGFPLRLPVPRGSHRGRTAAIIKTWRHRYSEVLITYLTKQRDRRLLSCARAQIVQLTATRPR